MFDILKLYKRKLEVESAYIRLSFNYPMIQESLRSGLEGYNVNRLLFEGTLMSNGKFRIFIHLDYKYSSACPCSYELAEHARHVRGIAAISHSQRSVAAIKVELNDEMYIDELVEHCRTAMMR